MTLDLPRALEPWRSVLELFSVELAPSLGDLVARLSVLVGPLERDDVAARGEPDGVAGIGRRGPFDRLLATDWALLHEVPDEFMRRAAEQQLSFFELARREKSADRRSIALFDGGVSQLGGPRVVQLAALVLLAQRARDANATFVWGILQDPSLTLYDGVNPANGFALLRARSRDSATADDAARWSQLLGTTEVKGERELWLVGGSSTPALVGPKLAHARLTIDDCLDPAHPNAIELAITVPRRPRRTARLEIPPPQTAVRLLRDPFEVKKARTGPGAPRTASGDRLGAGAVPLVFGTDGRRLFTRGEKGALLTLARVDTGAPPRAYLPPDGDAIVAVGQKGKKTVVLLRSRLGHLTIEGVSKRGRGSRWMALVKGDVDLLLPDAVEKAPLERLFPVREHDAFLFQEGRGLLVRLHHSNLQEDPVESRVVLGVRAAVADGTSVIVVSDEAEPRHLVRCSIDDRGAVQTERLAPVPFSERLFLGPTHLAHDEQEGRAFRLCAHRERKGVEIVPAAGDEVIGFMVDGVVPSLVVVDEARRAVVRIGESQARTILFGIPEGIAHAQIPQSPRPTNDVVVLTNRNEVQVRPLATGSTVAARYLFERAP